MFGLSAAYSWVVKKEFTAHSEKNFTYSQPIRINLILNENPTIETLNTYGWLSELGDTLPLIAHLSYSTPYLQVGCRITLATVKGTNRPRIFEITKIGSKMEYPDSYTVALAPVLDQIPQRNQYTLVNNEKINQVPDEKTSMENKDDYTIKTDSIDTTPSSNTVFENTFSFISDDNSPYSG